MLCEMSEKVENHNFTDIHIKLKATKDKDTDKFGGYQRVRGREWQIRVNEVKYVVMEELTLDGEHTM